MRRSLFAVALLLPALGRVPATRDLRTDHAHRRATDARIVANDNRRRAGRLQQGLLTVSLDARTGVWRPHVDGGLAIETQAFAEGDGELQTPGPLIRVPVGTEVRATVSNHLAKPMWVYGLGATRGLGDSTRIEPNARHEFRFRASEAGTFWYVARTDTFPAFVRLTEDSQLAGVLIVDPPGAPTDERVFAITGYATLDSTTRSGLGPKTALAINGRSYPNTEAMRFTEGDSVRWRFVNLSALEHPLHLHGFYFQVDGRGDGMRDSVYTRAQRRQVVTEMLQPLQSMAMRFGAMRRGNWIFHCHIASHITSYEAFEADRARMTPMPEHDPMQHMDGLVLRFAVAPKGPPPVAAAAARSIRLEIRSRPRVYGEFPGYAVVRTDVPGRDTGFHVPGPLLELVRNERVAITLVNRSHEQAAMHWHGIELESYPDGVPGVSGEGARLLPMIAPGDSLVLRFTPPRAGTFMYHSHSNELQQIASGVYGAIVVHDRQTPMVADRDRVLLFSDNGPQVNLIAPVVPGILLNGDSTARTMDVPADVPIRLRLINIRSETALDLALLDGETPAQWRLVARDGQSLAEAASLEKAVMRTDPGQIRDVQVTIPRGATRTLRYALAGFPPEFSHPTTLVLRAR